MSSVAVNPTDPAFIACPFPAYAELREQCPVAYVPHGRGFWFVTKHELIQQVISDTKTFSSKVTLAFDDFSPELLAKMQQLAKQGKPNVPTLLTTDPPYHTRNRRLVSRAFTPRSVKEHEPFMREVCADLISDLRGGEPVDFVRRFAIPLPVRVIAKALAVPDDRVDDFKRWSDASVALIGSKLSDEEVLDSIRETNALGHFVFEQIKERRDRPGGTDVLSMLVHARLTDDETTDLVDGAQRQLSDEEVYSIVRQLLVAGNETTTNLLTQMMVQFHHEPEWWQKMREAPEIIPSVVEEALRMFTPSSVNQRITTRDVELGGVTIPAGQNVLIIYISGDHDEAVFPDPERFDPSRPNLGDHYAFGRGIHFCVGASLARLETRVALEEMTKAIEHYELMEPDNLQWNSTFQLRAIKRLPMRVTA